MNIYRRVLHKLSKAPSRVLNLLYLLYFKIALRKKNSYCPGIEDLTSNKKLNFIKQPDDKSLIIHVLYGGLGDHLLHSHIPRIAKQSGKYSKVFLSSSSPIRNQRHIEYIWANNPYLDGFCSEHPQYDHNVVNTSHFDTSKENILDRIMLSYGLDDGLRWHEPELFFEIPFISELKGKSVYDPNFISDSGGLNSFKIAKFLHKHEGNLNFQFPCRRGSSALPVINFDQTIKDSNFVEFCSILISCERVYSLTTGTATLAAALKKNATILHGSKLDKKFLHSKRHDYILL